MKEYLWIPYLLMALSILGLITGLIAQPPTVTNSYPEWVERADFIATDQQKVFATQAAPRSNFVEVFKNGLLQTQELNPATCAPNCADYTAANVSGKRNITFLVPLSGGSPGVPADRVSLIYWR